MNKITHKLNGTVAGAIEAFMIMGEVFNRCGANLSDFEKSISKPLKESFDAHTKIEKLALEIQMIAGKKNRRTNKMLMRKILRYVHDAMLSGLNFDDAFLEIEKKTKCELLRGVDFKDLDFHCQYSSTIELKQ